VIDKGKTLLFLTTKLSNGFAKQNSSKTRLWWKSDGCFIMGIESHKSSKCLMMQKESSIGLGGCHSCLFVRDC
jgi:hypothetical protein